MSTNTENLEPTVAECRALLERHPCLTESGFYPYEKYQRKNDRRAGEGLPPKAHRPPVPITDRAVRKQIAQVRRYLRAIQTNVGAHFSRRLCLSLDLKHAVERWSGEYISNGAAIAGAALEGCSPDRNMATASAFMWLSITPEQHAQLRTHMDMAIAHMNGALSCVGSNAHG
jgi:hypothetical protein